MTRSPSQSLVRGDKVIPSTSPMLPQLFTIWHRTRSDTTFMSRFTSTAMGMMKVLSLVMVMVSYIFFLPPFSKDIFPLPSPSLSTSSSKTNNNITGGFKHIIVPGYPLRNSLNAIMWSKWVSQAERRTLRFYGRVLARSVGASYDDVEISWPYLQARGMEGFIVDLQDIFNAPIDRRDAHAEE